MYLSKACVFISLILGAQLQFVPCAVNTSNARNSGNYMRDGATGSDISDNANVFPNPFAWYTNPNYPGVTLPAGRNCESLGTLFVWTPTENSCIFDGNGYPFPFSSNGELASPDCVMELYSAGISLFTSTFLNWRELALRSPVDAISGARLTNVTVPGSDHVVSAAISIGHGVLNGLCGDCFLIEYEGRYMVHLQVDVRAWSFEATPEASNYVNPGDYGGNCRIPNVVQIDCSLLFA